MNVQRSGMYKTDTNDTGQTTEKQTNRLYFSCIGHESAAKHTGSASSNLKSTNRNNIKYGPLMYRVCTLQTITIWCLSNFHTETTNLNIFRTQVYCSCCYFWKKLQVINFYSNEIFTFCDHIIGFVSYRECVYTFCLCFSGAC